MHEKLIRELRRALQNSSDSKTRESSRRFFKKGEEPFVYGVKTPVIIKIAGGSVSGILQ